MYYKITDLPHRRLKIFQIAFLFLVLLRGILNIIRNMTNGLIYLLRMSYSHLGKLLLPGRPGRLYLDNFNFMHSIWIRTWKAPTHDYINGYVYMGMKSWKINNMFKKTPLSGQANQLGKNLSQLSSSELIIT